MFFSRQRIYTQLRRQTNFHLPEPERKKLLFFQNQRKQKVYFSHLEDTLLNQGIMVMCLLLGIHNGQLQNQFLQINEDLENIL